MEKIHALTSWTPIQRKWLDRLAKQLGHEVVLDEAFINRAFSDAGGVMQLNKVLGGKLDNVLDTLGEALWPSAA